MKLKFDWNPSLPAQVYNRGIVPHLQPFPASHIDSPQVPWPTFTCSTLTDIPISSRIDISLQEAGFYPSNGRKIQIIHMNICSFLILSGTISSTLSILLCAINFNCPVQQVDTQVKAGYQLSKKRGVIQSIPTYLTKLLNKLMLGLCMLRLSSIIPFLFACYVRFR